MALDIEEEFNSRLETIKCVVVGDTAVGKTRLICARTCNAVLNLPQMLTTHVPTVWAIDQYRIHKEVLKRSWMSVDGVNVSLRLWDTFGDHEKDRKFAYGRADIVLLCFSISSPQSFKHCKTKWFPEIRQYCPQVPIVVVGCKSDLRHMYKDDGFVTLCHEKNHQFAKLVEEAELITREQGRNLAAELGAVYYEVSVYTHYGIDNVFENAMRQALRARRLKRFWAKNLKNVMLPAPQMPYLPPMPKEPEVKALASSYKIEMGSLLDKGFASDVNLEAAGAVFRTHKIILAAASSFFKDIFISSEIDCLKVNLEDLQFVTLQSFQIYLRFVYCGELDALPDVALGDIKEAATLTQIDILEDLIYDIEEHEGKLKNNIQESYQYHFKESLKQICLVEHLYTDVIFIVDDGECYAHRSVLMARCDVMTAMFGGDFKESSTEKLHNADQLFEWCQYYIIINYKNIELHALLQRLDYDYQMYLQKNRWPPQQYLAEREYYDASMRVYNANHNTSGFAFWLSAKKRIIKYFNSFKRNNPPKIAAEPVPRPSFIEYLARKSRLI
nr:rho-related BTB domain-containing protein 1 isoform X2 [Parasteatoda tepidariorum]